MSNKSEYLLKICAIGSGNVQKTEIIRKYAEDRFDGNYLPTLGVDITTKKIRIKETYLKLIIVDTAGQEFFGKLRPNYYRGASGALIFCNLNDRESIESIPIWLKEFKKHIPSPNIPISIVVVINQKEKTTKRSNKPFSPKPQKKGRIYLQIIKYILFSGKKNVKYRKRINIKKLVSKANKEWFALPNSEIVNYFASKYELGVCEVDMKKAKNISNCFSHIAMQVIEA